MAQAVNVIVTANFEHNLESIRCHLHQHHPSQHQDKFDNLLDRLFENIIPNLQSHPMIGFDFLTQKVNTIEELRQAKNIKTALPKNTSIRQYNDHDYILLYSLSSSPNTGKKKEIALLSIKHQQQLIFDLKGSD